MAARVVFYCVGTIHIYYIVVIIRSSDVFFPPLSVWEKCTIVCSLLSFVPIYLLCGVLCAQREQSVYSFLFKIMTTTVVYFRILIKMFKSNRSDELPQVEKIALIHLLQ